MTPRTEAPGGRRLDAQLRASLVAVAVAGAALALAALPLFGISAAFSVAVGSALATGNLWALARIIAALLPTDGESARQKNTAAWALLGVLKMLGLIAVVWGLMDHGIVSPLPMLVGFAALPIGIAIGSLVSHRGPADDDG
jgi:hypothetical protein